MGRTKILDRSIDWSYFCLYFTRCIHEQPNIRWWEDHLYTCFPASKWRWPSGSRTAPYGITQWVSGLGVDLPWLPTLWSVTSRYHISRWKGAIPPVKQALPHWKEPRSDQASTSNYQGTGNTEDQRRYWIKPQEWTQQTPDHRKLYMTNRPASSTNRLQGEERD